MHQNIAPGSGTVTVYTTPAGKLAIVKQLFLIPNNNGVTSIALSNPGGTTIVTLFSTGTATTTGYLEISNRFIVVPAGYKLLVPVPPLLTTVGVIVSGAELVL